MAKKLEIIKPYPPNKLTVERHNVQQNVCNEWNETGEYVEQGDSDESGG